jgi:DNA-binding GntR family transcriptional regulator
MPWPCLPSRRALGDQIYRRWNCADPRDQAAELACSRAQENYDRLREIPAGLRSGSMPARIAREDRDFHLEIVRATQNSIPQGLQRIT